MTDDAVAGIASQDVSDEMLPGMAECPALPRTLAVLVWLCRRKVRGCGGGRL